MTADDIRELNYRLQEQMLKSQTVAEREAGLKSLMLSIASEFVAQVAEMNEHLREIASPKVARRWETVTYNSHPNVIDGNEIVDVCMRDKAQTYVYLRGIDEPWTVDGTVAEVCEKFGIPYKEPA